VLLFVVLLVVMPLAEDWDEAAMEERLVYHRTRNHNQVPAAWMRCLTWIFVRIRLFILPWMLMNATSALLLHDETSTEFLLDGLAITFVTLVDNLLMQFFLPPEQQRAVNAAIVSLEETVEPDTEPGGEGRNRLARWLFHRVYAAVLGTALTAVSLAPEPFMVVASLNYEQPLTSCPSITAGINLAFGCSIFAIAGTWPLVRDRSSSREASKLVQLASSVCDSFGTMIFLAAFNFLNPLGDLLRIFIQHPLYGALAWPLVVLKALSVLIIGRQHHSDKGELEGRGHSNSSLLRDDQKRRHAALADDEVRHLFEQGRDLPWLIVRLSVLLAVVSLVVVRARMLRRSARTPRDHLALRT